MKLVRDFTEQEFAESFALKLRSKGIPSHFAMFRGNNTHRYGGGPETWAVWVLIDEQHEDALKLIKSSRHKVTNPLSEDEIVAFEENLKVSNTKSVFLHSVALIVGLICLIGFVVHLWASQNA
jgi:hypothetical protein